MGQSEFRYSLRTGSIKKAAYRAQQIAAYIHGLLNDIRMKVAARMSQTIPDTNKIKEIIKRYIRQTLANDEQLRSGLNVDSDLDILTGSDMGLPEVQSMQNLVTRWLRQNDHSIVLKSPHMVKNYLSEAEDGDEQQKLARELLKAFQSVLIVRAKPCLNLCL